MTDEEIIADAEAVQDRLELLVYKRVLESEQETEAISLIAQLTSARTELESAKRNAVLRPDVSVLFSNEISQFIRALKALTIAGELMLGRASATEDWESWPGAVRRLDPVWRGVRRNPKAFWDLCFQKKSGGAGK